MNYADPAPEVDPNIDNPFIDNGQPLHERFQLRKEEILTKLDYLFLIL